MRHGFRPDWVNTAMTTAPDILVARLLANFVTVRFPRTEVVWTILEEEMPCDLRFTCLGHALQAETLAAGCRRTALRAGLWQRGYHQVLDRLEGEPAGTWRIHLFLPTREAIDVLSELTDGRISPGDPLAFDPEPFVTRGVQRIARLHQRAGRHVWFEGM